MRARRRALAILLAATFRRRLSLQLEVVALRHQLSVYERNRPRRLQLESGDRLLWLRLARLWLDNVIVLHERHLRRVLQSHIDFYHWWRVHRSLEMDAPEHRPVQPPELGEVIEFPDVGGLQRHYERRAA